jgi:hypothetical protein
VELHDFAVRKWYIYFVTVPKRGMARTPADPRFGGGLFNVNVLEKPKELAP